MKRLLALFLLAGAAVLAVADELSDAQRRMQARLPEVAALKAREALGENNRGLLEARQPAAGAAALCEAENRDRAVVYAVVARRTGASPESVGRARAAEIARLSRSGIWLQDDSGRWYRK